MTVKIMKENDQIFVIGKKYSIDVNLLKQQLHIEVDSMRVDFALGGKINYKHSASSDPVPLADGVSSVESCSIDGQTVSIVLYSASSGLKKTALMNFYDGYFTYALNLESAEKLYIDDVNYGTNQVEDGNEVNSRANFEEFFIWCPDRYQSILPHNHEVELRLSSTRHMDESFFRGDVGKYLVPPYVAAFRSADQWAGIGTMEIPGSQFGLHVIVDREQYHLNYQYASSLVVEPGKLTSLPQIGFYFVANRDEVLSAYVGSLSTENLICKPDQWQAWWAGPMYCTYADQVYQHTIDSGIMKDEPGASENCNEKFIGERLPILDERNIPYGILTLDYAWLDKLGDHLPHADRFPDLRAFIDQFHQQGKHVLLWFAPFFCESESELARQHPDWMLKNNEGNLHSYTWMKKTIYTPDFTHPAVRAYFQNLIRKLLGSAEGEFNADGFKIDGYSFLPDVSVKYHDPSWGAGELFQFNADKLIYDTAKSVKPDALVEQSFANPLFNGVQDVCRLNDASNYDTDLYENRAWVALSVQVAVPDTDDWSAFKKMFVHSTLRKAVYGIPTLYAIKYRGTGRMGGASGGYPVPISDEEYSRVSAILRVYQNAPVDQMQERFVDAENKIFWRKYTAGKLTGFYAAAALAGNTVLATFTDSRICLTAIVESQPLVPLPKGYQVIGVREMHTDGTTVEPRHELMEDSILLWMKPSIGNIDHYEIKLEALNGGGIV